MAEDIVSFAGLWRGDLPFCTEMVGVSYCDGSYRIRRERSPIYVFEYVERGEGRVRVDGREFIARAGDVYLLPRGSDHEYASSRANPWVKMWMNASGPLLDSLIPLYGLDSVYHVPGYDARMLFERILAAARSGGDARDIFGRIALLCHELLIGLAARVGRGAGGVSGEAEALRGFLDRSVESDVSVADMAARIYRSPSQTIRLFREAFGVTPYRYLIERRMDAARLLLRDTSLPVKHIAYRLRFADEHYFSNQFRLRVGVTPSAYRVGERRCAAREAGKDEA